MAQRTRLPIEIRSREDAFELSQALMNEVLKDLLTEQELREHWRIALGMMLWSAREMVNRVGEDREAIADAVRSAAAQFRQQATMTATAEGAKFEARIKQSAAAIDMALTQRIVSATASDFRKNRQAMLEAIQDALKKEVKKEKAELQRMRSEVEATLKHLLDEAREARFTRMIMGLFHWTWSIGIAMVLLWASQRVL